jgi:uncharacterized protein DUF2252
MGASVRTRGEIPTRPRSQEFRARSGVAVAISAYLGASDAFDGVIADFAETYAAVNARDHAAYLTAVKAGRVSNALGGSGRPGLNRSSGAAAQAVKLLGCRDSA